MCKVIVEKPNSNVGFILYNHLFSREDEFFTLDELEHELKQYHVNVGKDVIRTEINSMISAGMVVQRVENYKRIAML